MTKELKIASLGFMTLLGSCDNPLENDKQVTTETPASTHYINGQGDEIELAPVNDTLMRTVFRSANGHLLDTVLYVDRDFDLLGQDGSVFLVMETGGIQILDNRLYVHDFAGPAQMAWRTRIKNIYEFPFYPKAVQE